MYYLCSENKGADQLRGYREADLRLCFRIYEKPVFSRRGSFSNWAHAKADLSLLCVQDFLLAFNMKANYKCYLLSSLNQDLKRQKVEEKKNEETTRELTRMVDRYGSYITVYAT